MFIGNSGIYFHNFPDIVKSLAGSAKHPVDLEVQLIAEGGQTLEGHWDEGKAQEAIKAKKWDYVVLQEQSNLASGVEVNGVGLIQGWSGYRTFAKAFGRVARETGAKTVLLNLWKHQDVPMSEQQKWDYATVTLGREMGAIVVPVGDVWQAALKRDPALPLYNDVFHPTPLGSYLFAATFCRTVLHQDAEDLPNTAAGTDINIDDEPGSDPHATLVAAPVAAANEIKRAVNDIVQRQEGDGGYLPVDEPSPLRLPSLPRGGPMSAQDLAGKWVGESKLYRAKPAAFTLEIAHDLSSHSLMSFGGKPEDVRGEAKGKIDGQTYTFTEKGPDNFPVLYRAVLVKNELHGIAEVWDGRDLLAIGEWWARKSGS